jgi:hypothetical protein
MILNLETDLPIFFIFLSHLGPPVSPSLSPRDAARRCRLASRGGITTPLAAG